MILGTEMAMVMLGDAESKLQKSAVMDRTHYQPCLVSGLSPGLNDSETWCSRIGIDLEI
jgi:hypothetical protein